MPGRRGCFRVGSFSDCMTGNTVKTLIFDFGNVLFDLDLPRWERNLRQLYGGSADAVWGTLRRQRIFELYETGGIDTAEFVAHLCTVNGHGLQEKEVVAAWNSIFVDFPARRFDLLLGLRRRYQVFLLSNINPLHARWIDGYLLQRYGIYDFEQRFFDGVYYSHFIRLRKPEPEVYQYVLHDAELDAKTCLFFDDLEQNVAAAQQCGLPSLLHAAGRDIEEHLRTLQLI